MAVFAVLVTFVAPVVEELFYRGVAVAGRRTPVVHPRPRRGDLGGVPASHFRLVQFRALFGFAVLAVLTARTGRLGPAIAAHVAFNSVTIAALGARGSWW